jgi:hypothetical protein
MGRSQRAHLTELATRHARTPHPKRLLVADPARPECDYIPCSRPFTRVRPHQRFCCDVHRVYAWQHPERDRHANARRRAKEAS